MFGFLKNNQQGNSPNVQYAPMQETADYLGSVVKTYLAGAPTTWSVVNRAGDSTWAKGVRVIDGATGGDLQVHLVDNPAGAYSTYTLAALDKEGFVFDEIIDAGTTIDLDEVIILL